MAYLILLENIRKRKYRSRISPLEIEPPLSNHAFLERFRFTKEYEKLIIILRLYGSAQKDGLVLKIIKPSIF